MGILERLEEHRTHPRFMNKHLVAIARDGTRVNTRCTLAPEQFPVAIVVQENAIFAYTFEEYCHNGLLERLENERCQRGLTESQWNESLVVMDSSGSEVDVHVTLDEENFPVTVLLKERFSSRDPRGGKSGFFVTFWDGVEK